MSTIESQNKALADSFESAARPLMQWLNENMHPHVTVIVIVTPTGAELLEGVRSTGQIMDYVKD